MRPHFLRGITLQDRNKQCQAAYEKNVAVAAAPQCFYPPRLQAKLRHESTLADLSESAQHTHVLRDYAIVETASFPLGGEKRISIHELYLWVILIIPFILPHKRHI